ncbi:hypothetical protein Syun_002864 [Stephania yunnanensis]|uniref:Uncharacterized protein n=1 Tax=Stephania yunnanensis TaxID=152371 RepID=A0AAP0PZB1_9MAGN
MKIPARSSATATVAPWPCRSSFDECLIEKLEILMCHHDHDHECTNYSSASWLTSALETSIAVQKMTIESILQNNNGSCDVQDGDRKAVDEFVEDVVELLDSCNRLRDRLESVQKYIDSLRTVLHCLDGRYCEEPSEAMLGRARAGLECCETMERRCAMLDKCSSGLRKLAEKIIAQGATLPSCGSKTLISTSSSSIETPCSELPAILSGSKAISMLTCGVFDIALSFKSKRGLPVIQHANTTAWSSCLQGLHKELKEEIEKRRRSSNVVFNELREVVSAAKNLRDLVNFPWHENEARRVELRTSVQEVRRTCDVLEEGIRPFEGRINELYRNLISTRVALLDLLSQA